MDFIIKAMQLSVGKYIIVPQSKDQAPSRAAVFLDLKNMFNLVKQDKLLEVIHCRYPELSALTNLLYDDAGTAHIQWDDGTWKSLLMEEGVNQGYPLSSIFTAIVLHDPPLDKSLHQRAEQQILAGNYHNDGDGDITHLLVYIDEDSTAVPLEDLLFFFHEFNRLTEPLGA